ncbi:transcription-repair coupling factor [bacterium]|nr:transcription-repair coupling factor [bacterium]
MNQNSEPLFFRQKLDQALNGIRGAGAKHFVLSSLAGSASSLFASLLSESIGKPILIIAESYELAEQTRQDLSFFNSESDVGFFPHWDTIPYDNQSPDKDVLAVRFQTLSNILQKKHSLTVSTPNAMMQYIMPSSAFLEHTFSLEVSKEYNRQHLLRNLVKNGFTRVEMVEDKGEFSVRGEIVDIFPISESDPVRLDFFDEELESIKFFDIETQRSRKDVSSINIFPAQEILYTDDSAQRAMEGLIEYKANTVPQTYGYMIEQLQSKSVFSGIENLLPLFFESVSTLLDYFPEPPIIFYLDKETIHQRSDDFFDEIMTEYNYSRQEGNPTLDPDKLFLTKAQLFQKLEEHTTIDVQSFDLEGNDERYNLSTVDNSAIRSLAIDSESLEQSSVQHILIQLRKWNQTGAKIIIAAQSQSKADRIRQMLQEIDLSVPIRDEVEVGQLKEFLLSDFSETEGSFFISTKTINRGFRWINSTGLTKAALISDEEIFGIQKSKRRTRKSSIKQFFSSLGDLNAGDYVVHVEYGIGQYEGLKKIMIGQHESDFLVISYHGGDKVYVPVDKFHLVQKYSGGDVGRPKVNKLGNKTWSKTKSKVRSEVDDLADELVKISAVRKARKGVAFSPDSSLMNEFTLSFEYQETDDQEKAIADVINDMESENPMDRLVCGDVGFGKTEVAMRAAYKAAIDGYQVGVLVPTTVLALQHFESFSARFSGTPVTIGLLSRFQSPKKVKETLKGLKTGSVDIAIGTHRLLSKDVVFNKLGLLVIDEEQRFGVKHKESIKMFRSTVDTLTLTATPIPRTLHMSLVGIRDISIINTAPMDRRAIRTRLMKFNDYVIQEAVNREIRRNGQVFFIHNRVESIYQVGQYLAGILPKVKIAVAHGQLAERELEKTMMDFIHREYDVLLATTIVESGLDIPNVNTIIINNADQFGLSQLYQLRGRVGRSNVQAYAYLMTPREKILSETARKRLAILQELNHLGAGFKIANYDLELRGAGNVLGSQQSGHIAAVGFELYTAMIEEAVSKIQQGEQRTEEQHEEILLNILSEANIPDTYIESMNQRLDAYKSISSCVADDELWEVRSSLEDRFGVMPKETVCLFHSMQIKFMARELSISQLNQSFSELELVFNDSFQPEPEKLLKYLADPKNKARLLPNNKLILGLHNADPEEILRFLQSFKKEIY